MVVLKYRSLALKLAAALLLFLSWVQFTTGQAVAQEACIWDHGGTIVVIENGQECKEVLLFDVETPPGSYWSLVNYLETESPCRQNTRITQITQQEFNELRNSEPTSPPVCDAPPPPSIEDAEETLDEASSGPGALDADCVTFDDCGIVRYLRLFINILSAAVGIVIVTMIAVGGVQYSMSRDNPQAVATARQHIYNAILALVVYMGMVAFLQWIVPGGVLSG